MRIEGTVEDIKKFFKGADIYAGVCNENCDSCKRTKDCPVPAESEEAAKENSTENEFRPKMFNLTELSMPWENDDVFNESAWQPDTLHLTNFETGILYHLIHDVLPRHMPIYDWNRPWAEAIILMMRREIIKYLTQTNTPEPDAREENHTTVKVSEPIICRCRICGFSEVKGIFNAGNWASIDVCKCCDGNNLSPEVSLSLRPWLKAINTNAAKHAMDEHVHTHNESKEERICRICGVKDDIIDPVGFVWAAPDLCQCCADKEKPPILEEPHVKLRINDILIPAFVHDRNLKSNYKTLFFTEFIGSAVLSYCGTKLYVNRNKALQLPHPIPFGYFGKQKSGTNTNRVTAIRFYRQYLSSRNVQKDNSLPPSPSPAVQSGSDQIREIKPFVDMRKSKEKLIAGEKPLRSDLLIPKFEWDKKVVVYYKHLQICESGDPRFTGKVVLSYASARIYTTKEKTMTIPYPTPGGYEPLKVFATSARTAFRMYREYLAVQEQNQKAAKSEQTADIPEQDPLEHEQNPEIESSGSSEVATDHEQADKTSCDKCGTDISDMKGRNLCDDCQHAVIEAEAARKRKLEEKAAINERRWEKKALDEKKSEEPSEKGKMSEKTQKLHDLVTGHKIGPGTKFGSD